MKNQLDGVILLGTRKRFYTEQTIAILYHDPYASPRITIYTPMVQYGHAKARCGGPLRHKGVLDYYLSYSYRTTQI